MICPLCGKAAKDTDNNCSQCGTVLKQPTTQPTNNQQPVYQQPQQQYYQQPYYQQKPYNPGKKLGIASFVGAFITWFVFVFTSFLMFVSMELSKLFPIIFGLTGIILGITGLIKSKNVNMKNGFAITGIIMNGFFFVTNLLFLILLLID